MNEKLYNINSIDFIICISEIYLPTTQAAITIYNLLFPLLDHSGYSSTIPAITT